MAEQADSDIKMRMSEYFFCTLLIDMKTKNV